MVCFMPSGSSAFVMKGGLIFFVASNSPFAPIGSTAFMCSDGSRFLVRS